MCTTEKLKFHWVAILFGLAVTLPQSLQAQDSEDEFILRTYEVGDLIINIHDHPYSASPKIGGVGGGSFGGMGGGMGISMGGGGVKNPRQRLPVDGSANSANITLNDLVEVISVVVSIDTWAINGTGEGQIAHLGTALVIWQKGNVHAQINELLGQLRRGSGDREGILIDARWLSLNSDDLDLLFVRDEDGSSQIDRNVLDKFTRRPTSIRGITNCFSGQLVYILSGTQQNVVSGYIPVVGSLEKPSEAQRLVCFPERATIRFAQFGGGASGIGGGSERGRVGYQPIVEKPNLGTVLEIRPTLCSGRDAAVVDLKSTLTVLGKPSGERNSAGSWLPTVDRVAIETQELATTLRVPLGQPTLVGGLTHLPHALDISQNTAPIAGGQDGKMAPENPQIYLFLELRPAVE